MTDVPTRRLPVNQRLRVNILRAAFLVILPVFIVAYPVYGPDSLGHEVIEAVGILTLLAGVLGRFWAILYVGAVKNREVMQSGPYSMTRNPLYFFSTLAAFGIGLMMGAVFFALLLGAVVGGILYVTSRREQAFLEQEFGPAYAAYAARVPAFWPDPRLFRTDAIVPVSAKALKANLFDAIVFLAFIPIVELLDMLKVRVDWALLFVY
jgi:protein-S-isoprenylcysteine O-methyltransferase Ste14